MPDEPDQHYKPWLRDSGGSGVPKPDAGSRQQAQKPVGPDASALSADELLARPAPLPTDAPTAPGAGERVREGLGKVADGLKAANERIEPARRAREAGSAVAKAAGAALRGTKKAAAALGNATANAAGQAVEAAAPKIQQAVDAAAAGLTKTAASARDGLSKGGKAARAGIGAGAASAKQAVKAAIPERPQPAAPASELDRLVAREQEEPEASPQAPAAGGLPLFRDGNAAEAAPPAGPAQPAPVPPPTLAPAPVIAAAAVVPPTAPLAEALQEERDDAPAAAVDGGNARWAAGSLSGWARHPATWALAALALTASAFALGRWTAGGAGMSEAALGDAIDAHLLANPEIVPKAIERLQANRQAAVIGERRAALTTPFSGAWAGNASGDVTMVVFTDYACTFCRASVPDIDRLLRSDPQLKVVFRELPILSADSEAAARVALAAARRGRYMAVHRTLFRTQVPDAAARAGALAATGVELPDGATTDAAIDRELSANVDLARALGIDGTPAFVIGDRLLVGAVGYDRLRQAIREARD